ncbi:hypothetical protein [Dysgonomonas sp. HGC4]|uniref:hypothetical protein n=1 Tax=Dysgonomonas sp. HGC4 TaxID=1658009 RepID=UPI000AE7337F|nr:hypothetical protein [Dysgonomonas sp. HGC4]MBD8347738.1 hypothetical protein [Dysgonomonas sp. HGC4]
MNKGLAELKKQNDPDLNALRSSVNSYLGIMKHYKSFYIRREIMIKQAWIFKYGYVQDCCSVFKLNRPGRNIATIGLDADVHT